MQPRLRRLSKLPLNDLVAQNPLGEQAKVNLICLMKFKNKINFNKNGNRRLEQAHIAPFCLPSACGRTCILALDTGLIASERRCEWSSLRHGLKPSKRLSQRLATKLDKVLTSNLWESILPSIKYTSTLARKILTGGQPPKCSLNARLTLYVN